MIEQLLLSDRAARAGHASLRAVPILGADPQGSSHCCSLFHSSPFVISSLLQWSCEITVSDLFAQRSTHNHQQQHSDHFDALDDSDEPKT
jgi:hypothetical protein